MSDMYNGCTVVFREPLDDVLAKELVRAINQFRQVAVVDLGDPVSFDGYMARRSERTAIANELMAMARKQLEDRS